MRVFIPTEMTGELPKTTKFHLPSQHTRGRESEKRADFWSKVGGVVTQNLFH